MKRILYAGTSLVTTDAIAGALLALASDLGRSRTSNAVNIRVFDDEGRPQLANLVIGPASQIVALHIASDGPDPEAEDVVRQLNSAGHSQHVVAAPMAEQLSSPDFGPFDSYVA